MNNKIKVLLVEDERMLAEILADTLSDHNFEIKRADNGVVALAAWRGFQPDVIVTDIMMPQMDGYTLVKNLRKEGCSAPILFLTARSSTEDVVKGFEIGGNDFLRLVALAFNAQDSGLVPCNQQSHQIALRIKADI